MYGPYELDIGGIEMGHIRRKTKEEKKYYDALEDHLSHFHNDYELFRKIVKTLYPEAKETDIQKYSVKISASGSRGKGFGIWIEGYGKHAEQVPAWEYPKLSLFYRLLTALTAMKHNLDVEDAYRALSVELPKRLGHRVPKPEEIHEVEKTINELVQEGLLPGRVKKDVIDLAKELSQIVYEAFPTKESLLEHREKIKKQIRKDESWGVKDKGLGEYWYEVVLEDVLKKHSKRVTEIMKRGTPPISSETPTKVKHSEIDETLKVLESLGVELELSAEERPRFFAWLVANGLVAFDGSKPRPSERLLRLAKMEGAGTMMRWAAREWASPGDVETLGEIAALIERLGVEMKLRDLKLLLAGRLSLDELPELKGLVEKSGELREALKRARERSGLGALKIPRELARSLGLSREEFLRLVTAERLFYGALESVAIRGLPSDWRDIEELITGILENVPRVSPYLDEVPEGLRREARVLFRVLALMKDSSYLEVLEGELSPLIERIPERGGGLFRRDSPREKVKALAVLLLEGNLREGEAEERLRELGEEVRRYLKGEEVKALLEGLSLPFRARLLLEEYVTAERFLFDYAHSRAARLLAVEAELWEGRNGLEHLHLLPALEGYEKIALNSNEGADTLKNLHP